MKTTYRTHFIRLDNYLLLYLLCAGIFSCSKKNDTQNPFVTIENAKIISTDLNGCILNSGNEGTSFDYEISYKASTGIVIAKIERVWEFSNGNTGNAELNTISDGIDGKISRNVCIRFGSTTWEKNTFTLVSSTGLKSNPIVLLINRPAGAK